MVGTVRKIIDAKGFGFIRSSTNGKEYFFHREDCVGNDTFVDLVVSYNNGLETKVEFTEEETSKGARARNVMRIGE